MELYFKDTQNSYILLPSGKWEKTVGKKKIRAQEEIYKKYKKLISLEEKNSVQEFVVRRKM